jgi:peptide/nickel transport system ATP-binding protein
MTGDPLLKVEGLRLALAGDKTTYNAVEEVSFEIGRGEAFGLVGESGCGKSITALSVMGLLKRPLSLAGGRIVLDGEEIQNASPAKMRELRGSRIGMIFQEPMTALNQLSPVGRQIAEMFVLHQKASWSEAMDRAEEALRQVRVPSPARRIKDYPHQLSGGMRQRVMIAIALACSPELLIADEPTTALDVTVQAEIIDLMAELCAAKGTAILMISHDLGLVANMCKRVAVMYAGRIVEAQPAGAIFATPQHPYTQGLVNSLPRLGERSRRGQQRLREISGVVPSIQAYPAGCRFNPRCPRATDICLSVPPAIALLPTDGLVRCHHHG